MDTRFPKRKNVAELLWRVDSISLARNGNINEEQEWGLVEVGRRILVGVLLSVCRGFFRNNEEGHTVIEVVGAYPYSPYQGEPIVVVNGRVSAHTTLRTRWVFYGGVLIGPC